MKIDDTAIVYLAIKIFITLVEILQFWKLTKVVHSHDSDGPLDYYYRHLRKLLARVADIILSTPRDLSLSIILYLAEI